MATASALVDRGVFERRAMDAISAVEERLPVADWRAAGLRVWPLARHLLRSAFIAQIETSSLRRPTRTGLQIVHSATRYATTFARYSQAVIRDREHNDSLSTPRDVLFLGDAFSRVEIGGYWFDRLCDPLIDILADLGVSSLHLEPYHLYRAPRARLSSWIQLKLDLALLRKRGTLNTDATGEFEGFADFDGIVQEHGLAPGAISRGSIVRLASRVRALADYLRALIAPIRPRLAFVVDYAEVSLGLNVACHELGVRSVELQHGVQGRFHPQYGPWRTVPHGGYELLPDVFWVWSRDEALAIDEWARPTGNWHRAIVGGNPFLASWVDGRAAEVAESDRKLEHALAAYGPRRRILVTLQPQQVSEDLARSLLTLARRADADLWLFRLHPLTPAARAGDLLSEIEATPNATARIGNNTLLNALLRKIDLHVTHSSGCVIEAAAFGIPSIVTDPGAHELFPTQWANGMVRRATTPGEIEDALKTMVSGTREPLNDSDVQQSRSTLISLITQYVECQQA